MSALATRESPALTEYKPQGLGHIFKLAGIVTAGMVLVSAGGSVLFAAPLAIATCYQMFRSTGKVKDTHWCKSRDEIMHYKLSPKHKSIQESYADWCKQWGKGTINSLIEPMIGNCELCNFTQDKQHPYHGLRGILTFDDGESVPLTPHDYVSFHLWERQEALSRKDAIEVTATEVGTDLNVFGEAPSTAPKDAIAFLASLTQAPLQPVIIAGLPGSGKGILAAIALSLGVRDNGLRFWVFNPKNQLGEAGYWIRAERHYLKNRLQTDEKLFTDLMAVLEEFSNEGSRRNEQPGKHPPFVLLLEEITAIVGLFSPKQKQIFKSKITALASLLRSSNMGIWFSGQSINLEDLGLTGRSNRAMFTAIMAVGENRESVGTICNQLEIPFDKNAIAPGHHWITATGNYAALPAPTQFPTFPNWASVPNLIDLRSGVLAASEVEEVTLDNLFGDGSPVATAEPSNKDKLEQLYKLDVAEPTPIKEVEPSAIDPMDALLLNYVDDPKTAAFLKWIASKPSGEVVTREQIRCSYWAKQYGRDKESIDLVLIEAIDAHLLIETAEDFYKKRDIGISGT